MSVDVMLKMASKPANPCAKDFVLEPDQKESNRESSSRLQIGKLGHEGATVRLNNFSGVLRVVVRNDANEVENAPSPQAEKDQVLGNEQPEEPKGQTKLNFLRRQSEVRTKVAPSDHYNNRLKTPQLRPPPGRRRIRRIQSANTKPIMIQL